MYLKGLIAAAFGSPEPLMDPSAPSLHRKCTDSLIYKKIGSLEIQVGSLPLANVRKGYTINLLFTFVY